jgi:hypothetical protein
MKLVAMFVLRITGTGCAAYGALSARLWVVIVGLLILHTATNLRIDIVERGWRK